MELSEAMKMGGPYMHVITVLTILAALITVWKGIEIFAHQKYDTKKLDLILMSASLSVAVGFFGQIVGIVQALEAIKAAADVSPQLIFQGAIVSFYAPIYGLAVFMVFLIIWFVLREVVKSKSGLS